MYIPGPFVEGDEETICRFMHAHSFATVVSLQHNGLTADHIPVHVSQIAGKLHLRGHVARINPLWRVIENGEPLLLIFDGPHAYVSPSWYSGPGVPTWNYAAVHVSGRPNPITGAALFELLQLHTAQEEAANGTEWPLVYDATRHEPLLQQIGGFSLANPQVQAKFKLSQNRSPEERVEVKRQLQSKTNDAAQQVAHLMADPQGANFLL